MVVFCRLFVCASPCFFSSYFFSLSVLSYLAIGIHSVCGNYQYYPGKGVSQNTDYILNNAVSGLMFEKCLKKAGHNSLLNQQFVTSVKLQVARVTERSEKTCFSVKNTRPTVLSVFAGIAINTLNRRRLLFDRKQ